MGILDLFRRREESPNIDVGRAMIINQTKEKDQIEHERDLGLKHDILKDEKLFSILDALCYNYTKVKVKVPTEDGKHFVEEEQLVIGGLNQDYVALRAMVSQNNSLRFFSGRDAKLLNLETEADILILETQKDVDQATIENFVFDNSMARLAKVTNLDSIEGRKLRAMLIDVSVKRAEVADVSKRKENIY